MTTRKRGAPDTTTAEVAALRRRVAELEQAALDRARDTEGLRESERLLDDLMVNVSGAVYRSEVQAPWRDLFVAEHVLELCGYTARELTRPGGTAFGDLVLPEDRPAIQQEIVRASEQGGRFNTRYRIRHADGSLRWVQDEGRVIPAADGSPLWLEGIVFDITDRMAAAEALQESEQRFRTLVGNIPGAVYRCDIHPPYRDLYVSEGILDITGFSASTYLQDNGPRFGSLTLEDDRERVVAVVAAAVAARTTFEVRYRIRHADGSIRWLHEQGRATYADDGTPLYADGVLFDVTAQVAIERELREREERLRTIVENEPECVKLVDRDGNLLEMNPAGLRMLEADSLDQLLGRCICPMIVPADEPGFREMIAAVFRGETRTLVFEVEGLRGGHRVLETHSVPLWDGPERHEVRALLGVTRDITARRQAERALGESEERFRTLVTNIPGAVYRCEVRWPYRDLFLSDGVQAITGYTAREHLGSEELDFGSRVRPEDRDRIEAEVAAAVASRTTFELRYRIRHADGGIRWVQETGRATYAADGTPLFLDGVLLDITGQKLAEEALRDSEARLVEAQRIAQVGSWELDLSSQALHWSEEIYRIFELDPNSFGATYEAFLAAIHPDDRDMVNQAFTHSVTERAPYEIVHRLRMPDGRIKYVHERAETQYAEDGTPTRTAGTVQDITERRAAEQARQVLEGQLRQAQKMEALGTLAGGIAHDFNNILAAIIGHAELLAQDLGTHRDEREGVEGILVASRRARDLVQQILTFSRLREKERQLMALEPVILEALKLLRATLPATIEIRTTVTPEDHLVLADATQIHQVVLNLCTNAAHAMQERGGVLDVSYDPVAVHPEQARVHPGLTPGLYMRLAVRDTGHGMDRLTLERIFDPFFTTKQPGEGTGLGLAVVHGIMQSHDGAVTVVSEPGAGTVFNLYFPAIEGRVERAPGEEGPAPRGTGQHVLVVDDEPALVRITTRVLERLGYRVTGHTQAEEALAEFLAQPDDFDLIFTDLTMPRMTGLELAREITARRPDLPIILTSGYSGALDPAEMSGIGIREVIGKPFHAQTIAEVVDRALRSP